MPHFLPVFVSILMKQQDNKKRQFYILLATHIQKSPLHLCFLPTTPHHTSWSSNFLCMPTYLCGRKKPAFTYKFCSSCSLLQFLDGAIPHLSSRVITTTCSFLGFSVPLSASEVGLFYLWLLKKENIYIQCSARSANKS